MPTRALPGPSRRDYCRCETGVKPEARPTYRSTTTFVTAAGSGLPELPPRVLTK
jgi:hypothetical protein